MTGPGLKPSQRANPRAYVVAGDLRELGQGLVQRHLGELAQWQRHDELSLTALGIIAVLSVYRGLRTGPDGCGVQAPLEAWAALLGRSRRMVAYAFDELGAAGLVVRRRRLLKHDWVDAAGIRRKRCDVHGVAYLTKKACVRIARRGETRRLVVGAAGERRVLCAVGVVGTLLASNRSKLKLLARRVTDAAGRCTPSFGGTTGKASTGARGASSHSQARPGTRLQARSSPPERAAGPQAALDDGRLATLSAKGQAAPWTLWPELWTNAAAPGRRYLAARFDALAAAQGLPPRSRTEERRAGRHQAAAVRHELELGRHQAAHACEVCAAPAGLVWGVPRCYAHQPDELELEALQRAYSARS